MSPNGSPINIQKSRRIGHTHFTNWLLHLIISLILLFFTYRWYMCTKVFVLFEIFVRLSTAKRFFRNNWFGFCFVLLVRNKPVRVSSVVYAWRPSISIHLLDARACFPSNAQHLISVLTQILTPCNDWDDCLFCAVAHALQLKQINKTKEMKTNASPAQSTSLNSIDN